MSITYGKEISVGLWSYTKTGLQDAYFEIEANKDYQIKDSAGKVIAKIKAATLTKVKYDGDKQLRIYSSIAENLVDKEVTFDAADGNNLNLIFNAHRPDFFL